MNLQGTQHDQLPPEWYTAQEAAAYLGMSRQNFYQSELTQCLDSWKVGAVRLYTADPRVADRNLATMRAWLFVRSGLVAMGAKKDKSPLVPTQGEWDKLKAGEWDADCPQCGAAAVSLGEMSPDHRLWCAKCGVQNEQEMES